MIEIYAGKNALKTIQENGFKQELFSSFLGASGGPKWFILYQLDRFLFGEFFHHRTQALNLVGSSAGAFRAACFAQHDPVAAIERLARHYSHTVYSAHATPDEITSKAKTLLTEVFGQQGIEQIVANPVFKAHFIVARAKGLTASDNKLLQGVGLLSSYILNRLDRKYLNWQYERIVYQASSSQLTFSDPYQFATKRIPLTQQNLSQALLASGSIPLVMQGVRNIAQSPKGMYRDGGIIDYHFDLEIENPGLVLYPHFNATPKAGWFDKNLTRTVSSKSYDNVVLICPSQKMFDALPYRKIPDRKDFTEMSAEQRIPYWQSVLTETSRMAEDFADFVDKQDLDRIQSFS
ncbi:patatin-like phospholipase family protein [Thalassotalea sp. G2M2-11]|uniref:patatin-like phospholipase family protein n=1 Tax=Thalassotalea sp. G2M2-11 TaxID=2787627 RepID=UPI0019CFB93C|nr:patatin-like phospholipase family protein [Thalassotalea sp. G2M2-11]